MTTKLQLVSSRNPERELLLTEVMNEIFHRMPFGHEFELADGRHCKVVKMTLPEKIEEDEYPGMCFLFAVFVKDGNEEMEMIRFSLLSDHEDEEKEGTTDTAGNA